MKKFLGLMLCISFICTSSIYATDIGYTEDLTRDESLEVIDSAMDTIEDNYIGSEINNRDMVDAALYGISSYLDTYSTYYPDDYLINNSSDIFAGDFFVGIIVKNDNGKYIVTDVVDGYPAADTNISVGDELLFIEDEDVSDLTEEEVFTYLYYLADDSKTITIKHDDEVKDYTFALTDYRSTVINYDPYYNGLVDNKDEYRIIAIDSIERSTGMEFKKALGEVEKSGVDNLIIDLRNNPGGYVVSTDEMLETLVPSSHIYSLVDKNGNEEKHYTSTITEKPVENIYVLVNEETASAAEIMAGVLQDQGIATIVGHQTFGKGITQNVFDIEVPEDVDFYGAMELTNSIVVIGDTSYNGVGIEPDHKVIEPMKINLVNNPWLNYYNITIDEYIDFMMDTLGYEDLAEYQSFYGLEPTGVLDEDTVIVLNVDAAALNKSTDFYIDKVIELSNEDNDTK